MVVELKGKLINIEVKIVIKFISICNFSNINNDLKPNG